MEGFASTLQEQGLFLLLNYVSPNRPWGTQFINPNANFLPLPNQLHRWITEYNAKKNDILQGFTIFSEELETQTSQTVK